MSDTGLSTQFWILLQKKDMGFTLKDTCFSTPHHVLPSCGRNVDQISDIRRTATWWILNGITTCKQSLLTTLNISTQQLAYIKFQFSSSCNLAYVCSWPQWTQIFFSHFHLFLCTALFYCPQLKICEQQQELIKCSLSLFTSCENSSGRLITGKWRHTRK